MSLHNEQLSERLASDIEVLKADGGRFIGFNRLIARSATAQPDN